MTARPKPRPPMPVVERARLWCSPLGRPTWHVYVETRACEVSRARPGLNDGGERVEVDACWEHVFRCEVSGAQRRWGLEARVS